MVPLHSRQHPFGRVVACGVPRAGRIVVDSPTAGERLVSAARVRYLQPKELRALVLACPEWLRPVVALA